MAFKIEDLIKKILQNTGIILAGNSMASALSLVSFTIMAKSLGPELLAFLVLAQVYAGMLNYIFNVQTWESMIKFGADDSNDEKVRGVVKTNLIIDVISATVAFCFALLLANPIVKILNWDSSLVTIVMLYSTTILFNITTLSIGIPRLFNKFWIIAKIQVIMAMSICRE